MIAGAPAHGPADDPLEREQQRQRRIRRGHLRPTLHMSRGYTNLPIFLTLKFSIDPVKKQPLTDFCTVLTTIKPFLG